MVVLTPLKVLDSALGVRVLVQMKEAREVSGVLRGFDENLNLLLENATEYLRLPNASTNGFDLVKKARERVMITQFQVRFIVPAGAEPSEELLAVAAQAPLMR